MNNCDNNTILAAVEKAINHRIHFYCYRLPNETQLHFGAQIIEQHTPVGFYIQPFVEDVNSPTSYISAQFDAIKFLKIPLATLPTTNYKFVSAESTPKYLYLEQANKCIEDLKAGKFSKIVLSRVISSEYAIIAWHKVFKNMLDKNPNAFVFVFHSEEAGFWMGASPERYLSYHRNSISSMALAGTRLSGTNVPWGEKELNEQKIVADFIKEKFESANVKYTMSDLYTRNAGAVEHLCNDFTGTITSPSQVDKIRNMLHPTPALAGYPTKDAVKYICQLEKHKRKYYGGYIGPVDAWGNFDYFVNLRSFQFDNERYCIYVGGGLTADSDAEEEWKETVNKSTPILNLL